VAVVSADPTTTVRPVTSHFAAYVAGFIAAEGAFIRTDERYFTCVVALSASDSETAELLHDYLGVGYVRWFARRRAHFDDEVRWTVRRLPDLVGVIVPFMDEHLPPSHKRAQYLAWRAPLLAYWEHRARRRRACSVDGCDVPRRARGLCRHHLYEQFGV
jgi:hypothetical protein